VFFFFFFLHKPTVYFRKQTRRIYQNFHHTERVLAGEPEEEEAVVAVVAEVAEVAEVADVAEVAVVAEVAEVPVPEQTTWVAKVETYDS